MNYFGPRFVVQEEPHVACVYVWGGNGLLDPGWYLFSGHTRTIPLVGPFDSEQEARGAYAY